MFDMKRRTINVINITVSCEKKNVKCFSSCFDLRLILNKSLQIIFLTTQDVGNFELSGKSLRTFVFLFFNKENNKR